MIFHWYTAPCCVGYPLFTKKRPPDVFVVCIVAQTRGRNFLLPLVQLVHLLCGSVICRFSFFSPEWCNCRCSQPCTGSCLIHCGHQRRKIRITARLLFSFSGRVIRRSAAAPGKRCPPEYPFSDYPRAHSTPCRPASDRRSSQDHRQVQAVRTSRCRLSEEPRTPY